MPHSPPLPCFFYFSFSIIPRPPNSTLFPYTTLFRSLEKIQALERLRDGRADDQCAVIAQDEDRLAAERPREALALADRKSTRLNSSHLGISYAVFCLKKKNNKRNKQQVKKQKRAENY